MSVDPIGSDAWAHPFLRGLGQVAVAVLEVGASRPDLMSTREKAQALLDLVRLETQVAALKLRVLACADDVAAEAGARDAGAWLAHEARLDRGPVRRDAELATALADHWTRLEAALAARCGQPGPGPGLRRGAHRAARRPRPGPGRGGRGAAGDPRRAVGTARPQGPGHGRSSRPSTPRPPTPTRPSKLDEEEHRAHQATSLRFHRIGDGVTRIVANLPDHVANRLADLPRRLHQPPPPRPRPAANHPSPHRTPAARHTPNAATRSRRCSSSSTPTSSPPTAVTPPR